MKYRIDARYAWYNKGTELVLMYFIEGIPFTFDELPDESIFDLELIMWQTKKDATNQRIYTVHPST